MIQDNFDLQRFVEAQAPIYQQVLGELRDGHKRGHWMWFIFPQMTGLGHSPTARHYAIRSRAEAQQYLAHPLLGTRLRECTEALLAVPNPSISEVLGYPDDLKLRSSMTLFGAVSEPGSVFEQMLERFYAGEQDSKTLALIDSL